ncbi:small ribosomal subunit protein mS31 isoform X3 [Loxodonta africana]|uniref:small ribosomal subunit protein mS31 isoform X3 n=1 Tax=Loxodonta africana TaxID=9785 RepID=UPI0030D4BEF3
MFPRVSALLPLSHFSRLLLSSGSAEVPAAAVLLLAAPHGTVRTKNNIQRYFGINSVIYNKKDEQSFPTHETSQETSNSDNSVKENTKKDLINIIKGMKIGLSTVNVQTTKPPNRRPLKNLKTAIGRVQTATENTTKKRNEPLSPELLAAASAVAESLPFDKQTTKSELLRQLRRHEEDMRAQKEGRQQKVSFGNIISGMKVAKSATARVSRRPEHQIQFDDGSDDYLDHQKSADLRQRVRKWTERQGDGETVQKLRGVAGPEWPGTLRHHSREWLRHASGSIWLHFPQGETSSHTAYSHLQNQRIMALSAKAKYLCIFYRAPCPESSFSGC